jgi:hypothetical protein
MSDFLKREPIPTWRVVFWTLVATLGVFWFGSDHSWRMAFFAAIFTTVVMGGFFFMINWLAGDRGKAWSRKHSRVLLTAYSIAMSASIILKLIDIYSHKR